MAIDNAAKRLSIMKFGDDLMPDPVRAGGAAITSIDRADWLQLYRGIALGAPVAVVEAIRRMISTGRRIPHGISVTQASPLSNRPLRRTGFARTAHQRNR